jgi:hypothetical protein
MENQNLYVELLLKLVYSSTLLRFNLTDDGSIMTTPLEAMKTRVPRSYFTLAEMGNRASVEHTFVEAIKNSSYLLLNDDTFIRENIFDDINQNGCICIKDFYEKGSLRHKDPETDKLTYGKQYNKLIGINWLQPERRFSELWIWECQQAQV